MTHGDDMNGKNQDGNQTEIELLFDAATKGSVGKADKLLSRGVSPDSRDNEGRTPLIVASDTGNAALVSVIIRHGADVNAVDADGDTALMKAALGGHLDVAEVLISAGADMNLRNNEGMTALEIAQEMENNTITSFLTAQVAKAASQEGTEAVNDPDDDVPDPSAPAASVTAGGAMHQPEPDSYVARDDRPDTAPVSPGAAHAPSFGAAIPEFDHSIADKIAAGLAPQANVLAANEERIVFDALDNKQVRNINEKIKKVLDKAGFEVGDYVIDTVFKGSYMAVLKPRSQENKRWRKLKKHPDWIIDPRRLTELVGGCAARRLCLAEGIDVSSFSLSHFIELYYAKDVKLILTLAEEASINKYTVRQLKKAVDDLREHKDDHDPGKEIIRTLDQPVPILEDPDLMDLCTDKDRVLVELSKKDRKTIRALIKTRKPGLDEWKGLMDTLEGILSELEDE